MDFFGFAKSGNTKNMNKKNKKNIRKTRKMNCNPKVAGKTVSEDSCYTNDALLKIKDAYNKKNASNPILATDPSTIFSELKTRLAKCEKEDCWLKELPDAEQQYLDEYLFAPDKPVEWKKNKNEWLSNIDIFKVLKQYQDTYTNFKLFGPTPIDFDTRLKSSDNNQKCVTEDLCHISLEKEIKNKINKIGIVFNLDKHDESGSHWTSMFVDIQNQFIFYFDSAANETPPEIKALVKKIRGQGKKLSSPIQFRYYQNYPNQHQNSNTECGMYSLFFIITMLTGKTDFDENMTVAKKIKLFKQEEIPDKYVEEYRNRYFND